MATRSFSPKITIRFPLTALLPYVSLLLLCAHETVLADHADRASVGARERGTVYGRDYNDRAFGTYKYPRGNSHQNRPVPGDGLNRHNRPGNGLNYDGQRRFRRDYPHYRQSQRYDRYYRPPSDNRGAGRLNHRDAQHDQRANSEHPLNSRHSDPRPRRGYGERYRNDDRDYQRGYRHGYRHGYQNRYGESPNRYGRQSDQRHRNNNVYRGNRYDR